VSSAFEYASNRMQESVNALLDLLRIPSISALPDHAADTRLAAEFTAGLLRAAGMDNVHLAEPAQGYPVVRGDWLGAAGKPTLLLYGHYDVQPPDPLEEWSSPPFEPVVLDGRVTARGANDNKGQVVAVIKGVEALMGAGGSLPLNVKFAIEGEEESGGTALPDYLRDHREVMAGDAVFCADNHFPAPGLPAILTGLRGLLYVEVEARGAAVDLHSGTYGGAAPNPFNALAWIIAGLKDTSGHVTIPGFYDAVVPADNAEIESLKRLGIDEERFLREEIGSDAFFGEPEYPPFFRTLVRPTLDVHGIRGGFTGEGAKTVIPARATAKISMRLVPDQVPSAILAAFERRVEELSTPGIKVSVSAINVDPPVKIGVDGPGVQAAARAFQRGFGAEPVLVRMGGSIPVMSAFQEALGVEVVAAGFGLPDDRLHSPNEKFDLSQFEGGIKTTSAMLEEFA
jgi:acetylornithine deacetylase/succinyl-diaminopimelate desuccinylase-like protein